jgi:methyltransferase (TIGR00027 family)
MSLTLPVERASDTAFLTAFCRAIESERLDAHFRDPYARLLAGARGEQLLQRLPGPELTASGCIVRTCLMDSYILEATRVTAIDTVINLGAGLDTRPYRLQLSPSISWIEVDSPDVLAYKGSMLKRYRPSCALESVALDIFDAEARRTFLHSIVAGAERVLAISEGLLVYMTQDQVGSFARDLRSQPQFGWWLTDMISPIALRLMQKDADQSRVNRSVRLLFAPEEGPEFFRQYGWEISEFRSCFDEALRLGRRFVSEALLSLKLSREHLDTLRKLFAVVKLKRADSVIPVK